MGMFDRTASLGGLVAAAEADNVAIRETLHRELEIAEENQLLLQESIAELEYALSDDGWRRLTASAELEFSREGLLQARRVARVMVTAHPLIKRGVNLRIAYIWGGGGPQIQARAQGKNAGEQDVNTLIQGFLDDPSNRRAFTGSQARENLERTLATDGDRFLACFTDPTTGAVATRVLPNDEIVDVYSNPEDSSDPWFYRRSYTVRSEVGTRGEVAGGLTGITLGGTRQTECLYPALGFRPEDHKLVRMPEVDGLPVMWDAPVKHIAVNQLDGWRFGIGDAYSAIAWARAYQEFLSDWATLVKALSRFAWRLTADRKSKAQQAAARVAQVPTRNHLGEPNDVGATAAMSQGVTLEAIPKSGATIDSESGRPLASMIAAGLDVPLTMMLSDPGVTGARATAETLDRPTELMAGLRRDMHTEALSDILNYVIDAAIRAPRGPLQGDVKTGVLAGDTDRTLEITWPDLTEEPVKDRVAAIAEADGTGKMPAETTARLLLEALGVRDIDELLEEMTDPETGEFKDPGIQAAAAAIEALRNRRVA